MLKLLTFTLLVLEIFTENFYQKHSNHYYMISRMSLLGFCYVLQQAMAVWLFHQSDYKVDFEWAEIVSMNKQYVKRFDVRTFKYNRTTTTVNATFQYNFDVNEDLQIQIQAYRFASNEYRVFPVHFEVNFCDSLTYDIIGISRFLKCGNFSGCPLRKGILYHVCNWKPDESMFPPYIPSGKYMAELQGLYQSTEIWVMKGLFTIFRPLVTK